MKSQKSFRYKEENKSGQAGYDIRYNIIYDKENLDKSVFKSMFMLVNIDMS